MFTIKHMNAKNTTFERLLIAAKTIKGIENQAELARELNVLEQNITNWKSRGVPKNIILHLSEKWKIRASWFTSGIGNMSDENVNNEYANADDKLVAQPIDLENNPNYPAIRKVNLKLSAGIVGFSIDYDLEDKTPVVMRKEWFEKRGYNSTKLLAIKTKGDSMIPGINDGDTVVINTDDTQPKDGDVFAVNYEGELLIKRLIRDSGVWWLCSDNPDQRRHPRKKCEGDMCIIIGKIVHKQSEII